MKTFFKITKSKTILGLVVMILNISMAYYSALSMCSFGDCPANLIQRILVPTIYPFAIFKFFIELFEGTPFTPEIVIVPLTFVLSGIILLFFWYLIACLLTKLYSLVCKK